MKYDIRLLTLYKQHYRDIYDAVFSCDYSCWGYFDGLDVGTKRHGELFSTLWQMDGEKIAGQSGDFSTQNIGLLRSLSDDTAQKAVDVFWEENERMPFFGVLLLQLEQLESAYDETARYVEEQGFCHSDDSQPPSFCRAISYCTFDNTDLVLLLHGNSLLALQDALHKVERLPLVRYVHSVFGVAEAYLQGGGGQDSFRKTCCCLEERIPEIRINVVSDGSPTVQGILRTQLDEWSKKIISLQDAVVLRKNGHETFSIVLRNVCVRDMLRLFVPGALGTHQNPIYGKHVYNISTSLLFDEQHLLEIPPQEQPLPGPKTKLNLICRHLLMDCAQKLTDAQKGQDESLCAYYQAMFQTLNTMSQYEQFKLSENIFLALIPAFRMLKHQFTDALNDSVDGQRRENIKDSLCQFLEYANMVIYHTIHTDQRFLMIPGYSGTAFSIPAKLTLLFLWLSRHLIRLLNDSNQQYECILTPVMESKPMTHAIEFDPENQNRLIAIRVSTRLLFRPQELTVILSHEIAHYVGKALRCRKMRLELFAKLTAYYTAERLLPQELWRKAQPEKYETCKRWYDELNKSLLQYLRQNVESFHEMEPYANVCIKQLSRECRFWLVEQSNYGDSLVLRVPKVLEEELLQKPDIYVQQMQFLTDIQRTVQKNWKDLLCTGDCGEVIDEMFSISREIFSDMVALAVLQCDETDFREAFSASEGVPINEQNCPATQWVREDLASRVVFGSARQSTEYNVAEHTAREELYRYSGTLRYMESYARACYEKISQHLGQPEFQPLWTELQTFYSLISRKQEGSQMDIYGIIAERIDEYKRDVKGELLSQPDPDAASETTRNVFENLVI